MSLKTLLKESNFLARSLIFQQGFLLLLVFSVTCFLNIALQDSIASMDPTQETQRLITQVVMGLSDIVSGVITLFLLVGATASVRNLKEPPFLARPFAQPFFISYLAEALRAIANVLLWGLLLLIPGFIRYLRLIFVPFITLFSSEYRAGHVDALELSTQLTKGRMKVIVGMVLIAGSIESALEILPLMSATFHDLPIRITFDAISFLISIWSFSFLFLIFEDALNKENSKPTA